MAHLQEDREITSREDMNTTSFYMIIKYMVKSSHQTNGDKQEFSENCFRIWTGEHFSI